MSRSVLSTLIVVLAASAALTACGSPGGSGKSSAVSSAGEVAAPDTEAVLLAAGDVAACTRGSFLTARLLDSLAGEIILPGDAAYASPNDPNPYRTCFDSTWGRHKARIHPVLGNHDTESRVMRRYFDYFGAAAGSWPRGYYSFDVGAWHVLALNSTIDMRRGSRQAKWVAADLAAHPALCVLAYMHHPRFSSGPHTLAPSVVAIFPLLDSAGVDVIVGAHDHIYERFAPMHDDGTTDERGVRQFVVGTGGNVLYGIARLQPNSEAQDIEDHGILKLALHPHGYAWEFVPAAPSDFHDAGSGTCH
jgi:hypothetical protein